MLQTVTVYRSIRCIQSAGTSAGTSRNLMKDPSPRKKKKTGPRITEDYRLQCRYSRCGKQFVSTGERECLHHDSMHDQQYCTDMNFTVECNTCNAMFAGNLQYAAHLRVHAQSSAQQEYSQKCDKSPKCFKTAQALEQHKDGECAQKSYYCRICEQTITKDYDIKDHCRSGRCEIPNDAVERYTQLKWRRRALQCSTCGEVLHTQTKFK